MIVNIIVAAFLFAGVQVGGVFLYRHLEARRRQREADVQARYDNLAAEERAKAEAEEAEARHRAEAAEEEARNLADQARVDAVAERFRTTVDSMMERGLAPLREAVGRLENDTREAKGAAQQQWRDGLQRHQALMKETQTLAKALARPSGRGAWGQITLRRVLELAGLTDHVDFVEEFSTEVGRPDVVVRLPQGRALAIDAKAPIENYQLALQSEDDDERERRMTMYVKAVRGMVRDLSRKAYWTGVGDHSLDFVVMFIPGDHFLNAALERDQTLVDDALKAKVLLATPSSLIAILRSAAHSWSQEKVAENAMEIRDAGRDLYDRIAVFSEHFARIERGLASSTRAYNQAVGSFESRVLPQARKMKELGVLPQREIKESSQVEATPRQLAEVNP